MAMSLLGLLPDKPNPKRRVWTDARENTKLCTACIHRKPLEEFRKLSQSKIASHCRECEARLKRMRKHKESCEMADWFKDINCPGDCFRVRGDGPCPKKIAAGWVPPSGRRQDD